MKEKERLQDMEYNLFGFADSSQVAVPVPWHCHKSHQRGTICPEM